MDFLKHLSFLDKASVILAIALILCLFPLPYGFYTLIRFAVAFVTGCWAYQFYKANKKPLAIIAGAVAVLFQPLIKIVLDRMTWNVIDIALAGALFILVFLKNKQLIKD